jgi:hypothetical protein
VAHLKWQKLALIAFLHLTIASIIIFGVNREHWFDVSFSLQTVHYMAMNGINLYELLVPVIFVCIAAALYIWWIWRGNEKIKSS